MRISVEMFEVFSGRRNPGRFTPLFSFVTRTAGCRTDRGFQQLEIRSTWFTRIGQEPPRFGVEATPLFSRGKYTCAEWDRSRFSAALVSSGREYSCIGRQRWRERCAFSCGPVRHVARVTLSEIQQSLLLPPSETLIPHVVRFHLLSTFPF